MEPIGKLIPQIAGHYNLKTEGESSLILKKLSDRIEEIWGIKGRKNILPQKIVFNQIFLKCSNSAWSQEFQLQKHEILNYLNNLKIKKILDIRINL